MRKNIEKYVSLSDTFNVSDENTASLKEKKKKERWKIINVILIESNDSNYTMNH